MAQIRNLTTGEVIPQMGFTPTRNENGGWTASRDYYMTKATWESANIRNRFARGQTLTIADPSVDSFYSFLTVESISVSYEDSNTVRLSVNYSGIYFAQYDSQQAELTEYVEPTYRLDLRLMETSLKDHPNWSNLSSDEDYALRSLLGGDSVAGPGKLSVGSVAEINGKMTYVPLANSSGSSITWLVDTDAYKFCSIIAGGVTTYQTPTITWTEILQGNTGMTAAQLNLLGKISTPRGNPPTPSGNRNWMLTGATQEQKGDLFQTTIEWTLSERGGWDAYLYNY